MRTSPPKPVALNDLLRQTTALQCELAASVNRVLTSGWYILGRECAAFESEFAAYCGVAHCVSVANGTDALAIVDSDVGFDLLFTDVIMPGSMNGRVLAEQAVKRRPALKVLFTSGYTENAILNNGCLPAGVLLLPKPYRKAALAQMVRQAVGSDTALSAA